VLVPSGDRLAWAGELGSSTPVSDPALVRRFERAAQASGARALDVTVLALSGERRVPVVTLESAEPASYMKHHLRGFLESIGYFEPQSLAFVELWTRMAASRGRLGASRTGAWCTRAPTSMPVAPSPTLNWSVAPSRSVRLADRTAPELRPAPGCRRRAEVRRSPAG
jgi:hypothetical protein